LFPAHPFATGCDSFGLRHLHQRRLLSAAIPLIWTISIFKISSFNMSINGQTIILD